MLLKERIVESGFDAEGNCYRKTAYSKVYRSEFEVKTAKGYTIGLVQYYQHYYKGRNNKTEGYFGFENYLKSQSVKVDSVEDIMSQTGHTLVYGQSKVYASIFISDGGYEEFNNLYPVGAEVPGHIVSSVYSTPQYEGQKPFVDKYQREHYKVSEWVPEFKPSEFINLNDEFIIFELDNEQEIGSNIVQYEKV